MLLSLDLLRFSHTFDLTSKRGIPEGRTRLILELLILIGKSEISKFTHINININISVALFLR